MTVKKQFHTPSGITERDLTSTETIDELINEYQRDKDITDNLPNWTQIENTINNISNLSDARAVLKKLARVIYWLAKNSQD